MFGIKNHVALVILLDHSLKSGVLVELDAGETRDPIDGQEHDKLSKVLTDNGMAFADLPKNREGPTRRFLGPHIFDRVCLEHGIEHRLTKPYHPWTNGQAERMNRTLKDATVKTFHYEDIESLKAHVLAFVTAYSFAKHLKALKWKIPLQSICDAWKTNPSALKINPHHLIQGPHNRTNQLRTEGRAL